MRLAVTVQMAVMENGLNVTVGEGQWSDKIGAGAIGLFVAWPLAITAGMGAFKQKKLPAEIFQVIENCIMSGGHSIVVNGAGPKVGEGMIVRSKAVMHACRRHTRDNAARRHTVCMGRRQRRDQAKAPILYQPAEVHEHTKASEPYGSEAF